ncbi:GNAT family N-acetyltransferase [Nocardioides acrostichi]|uniref:GNAT family N-acetyltransferase n=1 Tax=Nocardioides acrostichi TaxID=2784339 RepID=A0A930YBJ1_9ACTN|nr:GNAT family N-acetyltransferase [Nocardioides acrostichi]MBF4160524.1 GNAT family N-acetyltransferase [Nocardioides acrostichi]
MTAADVSVRLAWADDARAIAALQLRSWPATYGDVVPTEAFPQGPEAVDAATQAWAESLARPRDARQRALVALERHRVTGFIVTAPASDPDCDPVAVGEVVELVLDPGERGRGHGSRLLQAAADTLVADGFARAVFWVVAADDTTRGFLADAGWAADGAHRELDLDGSGAVTVKQVRLHTALA